MDRPLTATQIIYSGMQKPIEEFDHGQSCRICGGSLALPSKPLKVLSNSWTDENLCRRFDSGNICAACAWFTEDKNRSRIWKAKPVLYATQAKSVHMGIPEFFDCLQGQFDLPAVFMIRGRDPNLIRKHIQWRSLDAVTFTRSKTKVLFYGLQVWKDGGKLIGTAVFDVDNIIALVKEICRTSESYTRAFIANRLDNKQKVTDWFAQNFIMDNLVRAFKMNFTPELLLASYIASHVLAGEIIVERSA